MKYRILTVVMLCCASLLMMSHSCSPSCDTECGDHGECIEGDCYCEVGYYGWFCEGTILDDFPGTYTGTLEYQATDTSFSKTDDITISIIDPANLELSVGPFTINDDVLSATAVSGEVNISSQSVTVGDFGGSIHPVYEPPVSTYEVLIRGQWIEGNRTYTVSGTLSRPI